MAPDHQSIKAVSKRYEKTALSPNLRFVGHVSVGRDVSIEELKSLYDAIILAVPHAFYRTIPPAAFVAALKKGGVFFDLKSLMDSEPFRTAGITYLSL